MWSRLIEIRDVGTQDTMELFLMEDQHVVKALSPDTQEKAFADRLGAFRVIRCFENLDASGCCHTSETGSKLALMITDEILRRVSIRSRLSQRYVPSKRREESASHPHASLSAIREGFVHFRISRWSR